MQITDKITLNLSGEEVFAPIVAHQGDLRSRVVECTLQKDGVPYTIEEGTTARATYRAASGVSDIHDAEIVGNAVVVPLIPSFLASPGDAHCDVLLSKDGAVVGTGRFTVLVSPAAAIGHDLEKSPEYQSFVAALADADQWKADTAEAISKATEATEGANTAAQAANDAAASVDAAKQAALDAAGTAATAAETANTAANGANTAKTQAEEAAQSAQTAATRANEAADGIESTGIIAHMQNTSNPHQVTAEQVGAALSGHTHTAAQVGAVPLSGGNASIPGGLTAGGTVRASYFCASANHGLRYQKDAATQTEIIFGNGGNTYLPNQNVYATYQMFQNNGKPVGDYEVGSWTPNCAQLNISSKSGHYVRIGKLVYAQFEIHISGPKTDGGEMEFSGLPYTSDSFGVGNLFYTNVRFYIDASSDNPAPSVFPGCYAGSNQFRLMGFSGGRPWPLSGREVSGSSDDVITGGIVYRIA